MDAHAEAHGEHVLEIPHTVHPRPDTGLYNAKLGIWLFLASEVMLFGALFSSFILIRTGAPTWPRGWEFLNVPLATANTFILILSSVTVVLAWANLRLGKLHRRRLFTLASLIWALAFPDNQRFESPHAFHKHPSPRASNF